MLRSAKYLSFFLVLMIMLAGCSAGGADSAAEGDASAAKEEKKIVVYSPHGEDMLNGMAEKFEKDTGIKVEFLTMGGGELVDRIRAEKENPQADVIYGNPSSVFNEMKTDGLLEKSSPSWAGSIDPMFKDKDGYWYGTIQTPVVMFYNNKALDAKDAPKDWTDLADPKYKDQIIVRSTTSAASRAAFASLIDQFDQKGTLEKEGWDFLKKMDSNIKKQVSDSSLMFQSIARQEGSISFWTLDGIIENIEKNKMPFTMVDAKSGSPVITDGIAMIKGAKHPSAAEKFIEYAGSKETQTELAKDFNRMPTNKEALKASPDWMKNFNYKPMDVDWENLAVHSSEWLQKYEDNIRDTSKVQQ